MGEVVNVAVSEEGELQLTSVKTQTNKYRNKRGSVVMNSLKYCITGTYFEDL